MNWILDTLHIVFTEANANQFKDKKNISSACYKNAEYRTEREEFAICVASPSIETWT